MLCAEIVKAKGEVREDEGLMQVEMTFDPAGGPVQGTITLDSTGPNLVVEVIDWYGQKREVVKKLGTARTRVNLTFSGRLNGQLMTGTTKGSLTYETFPEKKAKFRPPAAPGRQQPPEEYTTIGERRSATVSLDGQKIEAGFDFAAGKAGGAFYYPRGELHKGTPGAEPAIDKIPFEVTFPPQKVLEKVQVVMQVKDGWKGVAADGVSVLELVGPLPKGMSVKKGKALLVGRIEQREWKSELALAAANREEVLVRFEAPSFIDGPCAARVEVSGELVDGAGSTRPFSGQVSFEVVHPPVALVHGVWSNRDAWESCLRTLNCMNYTMVTRFDYSSQNNGNPETIATNLQQWLDSTTGGPFALAKSRGILTSKVDLVGHSMGGLIIRRLVADDPGQNKGQYKRVRRVVCVGTPHTGAPFCDWFIYFSRSRRKPTDEDRERHPDEVLAHPYWQKGYREWNPESFRWLVKTVRAKKNLDNSFFQDGDAVSALSTRSDFLKRLNAANAHARDVPYFFFYGDRPLMTQEDGDPKAWLSSAGMIDTFSWAQNEVMYDTFFGHLCATGTDGVVPVSSAKGVGLNFKPVRAAGIHADHIEITQNCAELISCALSGVYDRSTPKFVIGRLKSPAHLHAFDAQGRHVGMTEDGRIERGIPGSVFVGPEEVTGVPESIFVPDATNVRFEVRGYQDGKFGLYVRKESSLGVVENGYHGVGVRPGQVWKIQATEANVGSLEGSGGVAQPQFAKSRPYESGGLENETGGSFGVGMPSGTTDTILSLLIGFGIGAWLMNRFVGRKRRRPMGYEGTSPPLEIKVDHLATHRYDEPMRPSQTSAPEGAKTIVEPIVMASQTGDSSWVTPTEPTTALREEPYEPAVQQTKGSQETVVENGQVRAVFKGFVYCPFCGGELGVDARHCQHCKSRLPEWPAEKDYPKPFDYSPAALAAKRAREAVPASIVPPMSDPHAAPAEPVSDSRPGQTTLPPHSPAGAVPFPATVEPPVFHGWRWFFIGLWLVSISPMIHWLYWLDLFIIYRLWKNGAWFRALLLIGWGLSFPIAALILSDIR